MTGIRTIQEQLSRMRSFLINLVYFVPLLTTSQYILDRHLGGVMEINHTKEAEGLKKFL
jgi:hypothetical protein